MRKRAIIITSILVVILLILFYVIPIKISSMIVNYDPYTFSRVLEDDSMRINYGIENRVSPADYGFENYDEFNISSLYDQKKLNTWYLPTASSSKCIVLVHGRTSNRLKTMKYLELFRDYGIDSLYNICIPDLRNSGKSEPSKTMMGYKFAEDLTTYLLFLHQEMKQDTFILYGFSMGAMAIMTALNRSDLSDTLSQHSIVFEKLVFDSPLTNVKETLIYNARDMELPGFLVERGYERFNKLTDGYADSMKMSYLMEGSNIPLLILMGNTDKLTFYHIMEEEYNKLVNQNIRLETYDSVDHVKIYQDPRYKKDYSEKVAEFILE